MSVEFPDIQSIVVKFITDKPVRKTPYQVKGVFMKQYPDEPIIPMLDGRCRDQYLYPRVQVKILNEQIHVVGIHEGVKAVISAAEKFKSLDFGNITFNIESCEVDNLSRQFIPSRTLMKYRFITPWVALNHMNGGKYKFLKNKKKASYLNRLLGQNIIFLANEFGINLEQDILAKVKVTSLFPKVVDENRWGAFKGEFQTNFILPNYIGIGNGITRGFGTIYGMLDAGSFSFDENITKQESKNDKQNQLEYDNELETISKADVPMPRRKKRPFRKKVGNKFLKNHKRKGKKFQNNKKSKREKTFPKNSESHLHPHRRKTSGNIFSEEFDIEENKSFHRNKQENDLNDDQRFNTEKHHKKQHKF